MKAETIFVPEIHCDHCKTSIEAAVQPLEGVTTAAVDVDAKAVTVEYDETAVDREAIVEAIEDQGYVVPSPT